MAKVSGARESRRHSGPHRTRLRCLGPGLLLLGAAIATVAGPARADGPMPRYHGLHPLSPHQGAFCYIDSPHMHRVPPPDMRVYIVLKTGENLFIGDPVALGYDGPKFAYYGPHPLVIADAPDLPSTFCYLAGPHYHAAAPPPSPAMIEKAGVTWFMGPVPPAADPGRIWINEVHPVAGYVAPKADLSMAPPGYRPFTLPAPPAPAPALPAKGKPGVPPRSSITPSRPRPAKPATSTPGAQP